MISVYAKNRLPVINEQQLLVFIDECNDINDLDRYFTKNIANRIREKINLIAYPLKKRNHFKCSQSLIAAIENSSIPIDIFWLIVSFISLTSAALLVMGIIIAGITLLIAAASCIKTYFKKAKTSEKDHKKFQLARFKMYILDDLLARDNNHISLGFERGCYATGFLTKKITLPSVATVSKTPAVILAIALSIIITTTFYWGITDILTVMGVISATSLLVTPMAIAVAAGVALTLSILLAVKYHQAKVQQRHCEAHNNYLNQVIDQKRSQLGLKMLVHSNTVTQIPRITSITHQRQPHVAATVFASMFRTKKAIIDHEQQSPITRSYSM